MEDGGAEGSAAIGDGEQATMSLRPDDAGTRVCIFESHRLEGSFVGDSLYQGATVLLQKRTLTQQEQIHTKH